MRIWEVFPEIAEAVRRKHGEVGLFGHHDWYHAFRVGEVARQISLDEWSDERLSHLTGLAGLAHNADHIIYHVLGREKYKTSPDTNQKVLDLIGSWLSSSMLKPFEKETVVDAVLNHQAKNMPGDSNVLIALKDADRVVNFDEDVIARSGQNYPNVPVVDYRYFLDNPDATFREPGSVMKDLANCFDWVNPKTLFCVRTRLGRKMAEERAVYLRDYLERVKSRLTEIGLCPYPF